MGDNRRTGWHWDKAEHEKRLHDAGSTNELSRRTGLSHNAIRNAQKKLGIAPIRKKGQAFETGYNSATAGPTSDSQQPHVAINGEKATIVAEVRRIPTDTLTVENLMAAHDLSPEEWEPAGIRVNRWDSNAGEGEIITLAQARLNLRKKPDIKALMPARLEGWKPPSIKPAARNIPKSTPIIKALFGDDHAPFQEKALEEATLRWLKAIRPHEWGSLGDLMDIPGASRWPYDPSWHADEQECVDEGARILARRIAASPESLRWYAPGNHCWRLVDFARERMQKISGLKQAQLEKLPEAQEIWDLGRILRLDELGIEYHKPAGKFHDVEVKIAPGLVARHRIGSPSKQGRSTAAQKKACSFLRADDHKQGMEAITRWNDDRKSEKHWNISIGALCNPDLHRKYTEDGDWQHGFATVTLWPDSTWQVEFAEWNGTDLLWRGERW